VTAPRPTILLTGFGPFPGIADNATTALVPALAAAARAHFPDHDIVDEVLPVTWTDVPQILSRLVAESDAALALHFGVAKAARGFLIERQGRNACDPRHDASGALPQAAHVISEGPATLASTFPVERIMGRLQHAGLPCAVSDNAGGYLCNALLYHSLTAAHARATPFLSGFIHLPASLSDATGSDSPLTWDDALAGGIEIIAACIEKDTVA
jgi:pyroglutamyl-peptidase